MRRHGLEVTTQTLWDQIDVLARRLQTSDAALLKHALTEPAIGLDQTSWGRLDGKLDKPWQMRCITTPGPSLPRLIPVETTVAVALGDSFGSEITVVVTLGDSFGSGLRWQRHRATHLGRTKPAAAGRRLV